MTRQTLGLGFLVIFAVSQGARDAFFGNAFQSVSFWVIAILTFGLSVTVIGGWAALRDRRDIQRLVHPLKPFLALNLTSTAAWFGFFLGLKYLEPAVVAILFNGIGTFVILAIRLSGRQLTVGQGRIRIVEGIMYTGFAAALIATVLVVLTDRSGWDQVSREMQVTALIAVLFSGMMIATSHLIARTITDRGVSSEAVTGGRHLLAMVIAGGWLIFGDTSVHGPSGSDLAWLAGAVFGLIILPSHILQLGVARTPPLTTNVIRALGPVFVFAVQQIDGRLSFSGATMACVIAYCVFAVAASGLRAGGDVQESLSSAAKASAGSARRR